MSHERRGPFRACRLMAALIPRSDFPCYVTVGGGKSHTHVRFVVDGSERSLPFRTVKWWNAKKDNFCSPPGPFLSRYKVYNTAQLQILRFSHKFEMWLNHHVNSLTIQLRNNSTRSQMDNIRSNV